MAPQSSDSRHEFVDKQSDVLSDATDLDALLAAILDDQSAPPLASASPLTSAPPLAAAPPPVPAPIKAWPTPASEARREPTFFAPPAPPPIAAAPAANLEPLIVPVDRADTGADAFAEFLSESGQTDVEPDGVEPDDVEVDEEAGALAEFAPAVANRRPSKDWRETLAGPAVQQALLVTGFVIALLAIGTVYFRADGGDGVVSPTLAATALEPAPAASPVGPPTTASSPVEPRATASSPAPVVDLAPPPEPTAKPRVITKPPPPPASGRANPVRAAVPPQNLPSPSGPPVGAAPAALQPVDDGAAREDAPTAVALPVVEAPRPTSSPAVPEAVAPTVPAGSAEPVTTAAPPPVPAAAARTTPARLLTGGVPEYPTALRTARVGGNVEVRFTIDSRGHVINVRSMTGPPQLRSVAEAAVRRWRYEPAQRGNVAIESETSVNFNFDPSAQRRPQQ